MPYKNKTTMLPCFCLLTGALLWASSFVALKIAFRHYDPMVVIFGRMVVGSLCFLLLTVTFKSLSLKQISWFRLKKDIRIIAVMVACEPCLAFLFESRAIELTTTSQVGLITSMMPLMVSVIAFFILKESLSQRTFTGLVVSVFGACWLSFTSAPTMDAPNPPLGNLLEIIAMALSAGYTICLKKLTEKGHSPFFLTGLQAVAGSVFYCLMLFLPSTTLPTAPAPPQATLAIVYLGAAVTMGAYGSFNYGVSRIPAGQAAAFINLIPIFALIFGMVILNERLMPEQYMACSVILGGIYLSRRKTVKTISS